MYRRHRADGLAPVALRNENGLALLSALLSVALLTLIVVEMTDATFVHSHLTRNAGNVMAAQLLARSAQIGAEEALRNTELREFVDNFIDAEPLTLPTTQGHMMRIAIRDETARLNLNDVLDTPEPLQTLFGDLDVEPRLLESIRARLETDEGSALRNLSSDCSLAVACEPRRGELRSFDDIRTIEGFTDEVISRIRPFVTAYPGKGGKINLRTAKPEVLRAIGCEETESLPPLPRSTDDINAWAATDPCAAATVKTEISANPKFYTILTIATVGDATQSVEALVEIRNSGGGPIAWKQRPVWGVGPGGVP